MIDVSIVIVAWNVRDLLYNCISSIYKETKDIKFEVIYVDNASSDDSVKMIQEQFPHVILIQNNENLGFAPANNQGIAIAKGRYILLLNSDTVILNNAIAKTVSFADQHSEGAVFGCKVLNSDGTLQMSCSMYDSILNLFLSATYLYKVFPKNKFFGREHMTWWNHNSVREVDVIVGCYFLVRKQAIEAVGLMDETSFMYCDDTEWCYRFTQNGWKVIFTPDAQIIHYGGQNTEQLKEKFFLQLQAAKIMFIRKRYRFLLPLACFLRALFLLLRVPYWFAVGVLHKDKRNIALQTVKIYLKGSFYCLVNWEKLLMNKESTKGKL